MATNLSERFHGGSAAASTSPIGVMSSMLPYLRAWPSCGHLSELHFELERVAFKFDFDDNVLADICWQLLGSQ